MHPELHRTPLVPAAWGAETYARYRRTTSNHFHPVLHLVRRLKLDDAVAVQIFDSTRRVTEESVRIFQQNFPWVSLERPPINTRATMYVTLRPDQVMSDKAAKDRIKKLADEHCAFVRSLLGDAGFQEYHDFARGWIVQMQRGRYVHLDFSMEL